MKNNELISVWKKKVYSLPFLFGVMIFGMFAAAAVVAAIAATDREAIGFDVVAIFTAFAILGLISLIIAIIKAKANSQEGYDGGYVPKQNDTGKMKD